MPSKPVKVDASPLKWFWYEFCRFIVRLTTMLAFQTRCTGQENIPKTGAVLMVANHQSHLDPPVIGSGCPRHMHFIARETLFRFKPFGMLMHSLDAIPLNREGMGLAGVKETLRRLRQGKMVLVFPEATRSRDGEIGRLKPGFASMAVRGGAAILPVVIEGAYDVWPHRKRFPGLGAIHVHYGPPLLPEQMQGLGEREIIREVERRLRECQAVVRQRAVLARQRTSQPEAATR
jgi:1-acyl-sn-glycerol-3-phosphate acyltransferase